MSNKYTNTVKAAAYSLGVHPEVLQQCLDPMRVATERLREKDSPDFYVIQSITVSVLKGEASEHQGG
jgi:hypothetical protein